MKYHTTIKNIPEYYIIGKRKYYLTANTIFTRHSRHIISIIMQKMKTLLSVHLYNAPVFKHPVQIEIDYYSHKKGFDIDNKGYIWVKAINDVLQSIGKIPDDSVEYIPVNIYKYIPVKSPEPSLTIIITEV